MRYEIQIQLKRILSPDFPAALHCSNDVTHSGSRNPLVKSDVTGDITSISGSKRSVRSEKQTTMAELVNLFTVTSFFSEAPLKKGLKRV